MDGDIVLAMAVAAALTFGFTNGLRDTAGIVATSISTRALPPRLAVLLAAFLSFAGAFISLEVAATIAEQLVRAEAITPSVILAGVVGAIALNLIAWHGGISSSSSHALIGGVLGAVLAGAGAGAVLGDGVVEKVVIPALVAPLAAVAVGALAIAIIYRVVGERRPGPVGRGFRRAQVISGGLLALGHGSNDAQKTIGVITLALVANGNLGGGEFEVPFWAIASTATALALGTYAGGRRMIRARGMRIVKLDAAQGFAAEGAGAAVLLTAGQFGIPVSTTHVSAGGIVGAGAARRLSAERWGVAPGVLGAWLLTLPAAALAGAGCHAFVELLGAGAAGSAALLAAGALAAVWLLAWRARRGRPVPSA